MFSKLLPLLVILLIELCSSENLSVGDDCVLEETKQQSTCKLLTNCEEAVKELQNNRKQPQICDFANNDSIVVCCPSKQEATTAQPTRQPGLISKRKCQEYSAYVFEKVRPPVHLAPDIVRNGCGHKVVKLIDGGLPAERREFPHIAALGYLLSSGDIIWGCAGTIISEEYILTAAHCLNSRDFGPVKYVQIGVTNLKNPSMYLQQIPVSKLIAHPEYIPSSYYNDIALLRLEKAAKLNPNARPACLYLKKEITGAKAIATGWGDALYSGVGSGDLHKVTLNLFDHQSCNYTYRNGGRKLKKRILDDSQFCAGGVTYGEEEATCQGDSGGPLQIYHISDEAQCMYDIIGVSSFGKTCAGIPRVYTRVSNYISWIEDIVWPIKEQ